MTISRKCLVIESCIFIICERINITSKRNCIHFDFHDLEVVLPSTSKVALTVPSTKSIGRLVCPAYGSEAILVSAALFGDIDVIVTKSEHEVFGVTNCILFACKLLMLRLFRKRENKGLWISKPVAFTAPGERAIGTEYLTVLRFNEGD